MIALRLEPRVKALGNGKFTPIVGIQDAWGGESVWGTASAAPTHDAALALARRLVAAALAEEPAIVEICRPAWR